MESLKSPGQKKGPWTPQEDKKLLDFIIQHHGHGTWRSLPEKAGLERCGKSCRIRWRNYLNPDIKRGNFNLHEDQTIIRSHALLGNRWSTIAAQLPGRTDNEIKNYWNTHLKKRLAKMGIDPVTHKPVIFANGAAAAADQYPNCKNLSNLSHMAQWETVRLQAEARSRRQCLKSVVLATDVDTKVGQEEGVVRYGGQFEAPISSNDEHGDEVLLEALLLEHGCNSTGFGTGMHACNWSLEQYVEL